MPNDLDALATDLGRAGYLGTIRAAHEVGAVAEEIGERGAELCISETIGASITVDHDHLQAEVGPEDWRGHFVEFGTPQQPPSPYMTTAADEIGPKLGDRLADAIARDLAR